MFLKNVLYRLFNCLQKKLFAIKKRSLSMFFAKGRLKTVVLMKPTFFWSVS